MRTWETGFDPGSKKQKLARGEGVSFSQSVQLAEDHYVKLLKITGRLENTEIASTQKLMEEVKKEVAKFQKPCLRK